MSNRTVTVALRATNAQFDTAYTKSAALAKCLGSEVEKSQARSNKAMSEVGKGGLLLGGALVAGFGLAVKSAADFEARMSLVKTLSGATAGQMRELRGAALDMGQSMGFSAGQTADAEAELVKAGISVSDIMGGALKGSLALAAAGQIDVAKATEIATYAMTEFALEGKDIPHVADLLAAGADKALGGVADLGEALKSGGLVAHQFGQSIETTVGVLASFAQSGLMGEAAGTDLRQMLLKLANPSAQAADTMHRLGINVYDASGHFVSMVNLAGQLHDKLGKVDEATRNAALATIFGSRAIVGANILYNEGARGLQAWIDNINASGFAMHQATGKLDNLQGDVTKLGAALQKDLIQGGSQATGVLRGLTQGATEAVKAYGDLPPALQGGVTAMLGVGGGALLLGGAFLTAAPKIKAFDAALLEMTNGSIGAKTALAGLGKGLGIIAGLAVAYEATSALTDHFGYQAPKVNALTNSIIDLARTGKPAGEFAKTFGKDLHGFREELQKATDPSLLDRVDKIGEKVNPFAWFGGGGNIWRKSALDIKALDGALAGLVSSGNGDVASLALRSVGVSAKDAVKDFPAYAEALAGVSVDSKLAGTSADLLSGKITSSAASAGLAVSSLDAYAKALNLSKDEIKNLSDEVSAWSKAIGGFEEPLKAYTDLLQTKTSQAQTSAAAETAAEHKSMAAQIDAVKLEYRNRIDAVRATKGTSQATIRALEDQRDATVKGLKAQSSAWKAHAASVTVSIDEYERSLQKQVDAEQAWAKNMLILSSRVSEGTLDQLARMGPEGAPLVAQLVKASAGQLAKLDGLFASATSNATNAVAAQLRLAQPVLTAIAAQLGQATAARLAAQLAAGTTTVAAIAAQYGIDVSAPIVAGANRAKAALASIPRNLTVNVALHNKGFIGPTIAESLAQQGIAGPYTPAQMGVVGHAAGGLVTGPGNSTSDSILRRLSNGEFVVKAAAVGPNLAFLQGLNSGAIRPAQYAPRMTAPAASPATSSAGGGWHFGDIHITKLPGERDDLAVVRELRDLAFTMGS